MRPIPSRFATFVGLTPLSRRENPLRGLSSASRTGLVFIVIELISLVVAHRHQRGRGGARLASPRNMRLKVPPNSDS